MGSWKKAPTTPVHDFPHLQHLGRCQSLFFVPPFLRRKQFDGFPPNAIKSYTKQILEGLDYLHGNNIAHRGVSCVRACVHTQSASPQISGRDKHAVQFAGLPPSDLIEASQNNSS